MYAMCLKSRRVPISYHFIIHILILAKTFAQVLEVLEEVSVFTPQGKQTASFLS